VVTLPNYMKLILNFRLLINFDRPIPLCGAVHAFRVGKRFDTLCVTLFGSKVPRADLRKLRA
jgi:hypothetical protein